MRVRKTTPEQELKAKEDAFLKLSGEERLCILRKVNERFRKPGVNYALRGSHVTVKHTL